MSTNIGGFVKPGFEKVMEVYRNNIESGLDKGSNFAAYYKGELVVNVWGGIRNSITKQPWTEDTLSLFYSATKACVAFVIAHLVERGLLDYKETVSTYWPEFAQKGKENITLEQLISHSAGLPNLDEPFNITELRDDFEGLSKKLAAQEPFWTPGDGYGYHALTFALYLDVLVRKVDPKRRSIQTYFREEFTQPIGAEFFIGLPREYADRTTHVELLDEKAIAPEVFMEYLFKHADKEVVQRVFASKNPQDWTSTDVMNQPEMKELPCGSSHGHSTSESLAKIYSALVTQKEFNGKPLLSSESLTRFETPLLQGTEKCYAMSIQMAVGTIATNVVEDNDYEKPLRIFGHGGYGGQIGMGDRHYQVGLAYTSCYLTVTLTNEVPDARSDSLITTLYECIYKMENITKTREVFQRYANYKEKLDESRQK